MLKVPQANGDALSPVPTDAAAGAETAPELLDQLKVRDAMTALNQSGEDFTRRLRGTEPAAAGEVMSQSDRFLRERAEGLEAGLSTPAQKRLFEVDLAAYRQGFLPRVEAIREGKTREYLTQVTERQGRALTDLATSPETVFDDTRLNGIRDLLLASSEQSLADLPDGEKAARLRECEGEYYRAVVEKRLEHDPASADSLLKTDRVAAALGKESVKRYRSAMAEGVADRKARTAARQCMDEGLSPTEAKKRLGGVDGASRYYADMRYQRNLEQVDAMASEADREWKKLAASTLDAQAIPEAVRRTRPELAEFLSAQVAKRQASGGQREESGYGYLLERIEAHQPLETAESLGTAKGFYDTLDRLGGPDSAAAAVYLRFARNKATEEDQAWLRDLAGAKAALGGKADEQSLSRYVSAREEYLRRSGNQALLPKEQRELLESLR